MDRALGCFLGACIGDAAGAPLEFYGSTITAAVVQKMLQFPGGGVLGVDAGQITDDSELAISLARGLITARRVDSDSASLSECLNSIASHYFGWYNSSPFDIGNTTRAAMQGSDGLPSRMAENALTQSEANGSLMRCTPLAIWGRRLPDSQLGLAALCDSLLTHPSPVVAAAESAYVLAAAHLIRGNSVQQAVQAAEQWLQNDFAAMYVRGREILHVPEFEAEDVREGLETTQTWLANAKAGKLPPATVNIGWAKIAFTYAFGYLLHTPSMTFEDAVSKMLLQGGDTDTNAAIVGGLMGASIGANNIPQSFRDAIVKSQPSDRPDWLWPSAVPELVQDLWDAAPASLTDA